MRSDRKHTRQLGQLRRRLVQAAKTVSGSTRNKSELPDTPVDSIRRAARIVARNTALNCDNYWQPSDSRDFAIDVVDIFSGCGGMSAGFRLVNGVTPIFRLATAIDIDDVSNSTYQDNLGIAPLNKNVSALAREPKRIKGLLTTANCGKRPLVLIGCAPCQGFSSHRKSSAPDPRNSLFANFVKIALEIKPSAIVIENVPEILCYRNWGLVQKARRQLESAGYSVHLDAYNMAEFGVSQERFRAVLLALPHAFLPPKGFLHRDQFRTVRDAIAALPGLAAGERIQSDPLHYSASHKESTLRTIRAVPKDGGSRPEHVGPSCLRRAKRCNGKAAYEDVYGRLHWDRPAITITGYARNPASGRFVHPEQDRGLSIREAALLQGFPSRYRFSGSLDKKFRQIGNAVPPVFAAFLASYLIGEILGDPLPPGQFEAGITSPVGESFSRLIPSLKAGPRREKVSSVVEN